MSGPDFTPAHIDFIAGVFKDRFTIIFDHNIAETEAPIFFTNHVAVHDSNVRIFINFKELCCGDVAVWVFVDMPDIGVIIDDGADMVIISPMGVRVRVLVGFII